MFYEPHCHWCGRPVGRKVRSFGLMWTSGELESCRYCQSDGKQISGPIFY